MIHFTLMRSCVNTIFSVCIIKHFCLILFYLCFIVIFFVTITTLHEVNNFSDTDNYINSIFKIKYTVIIYKHILKF